MLKKIILSGSLALVLLPVIAMAQVPSAAPAPFITSLSDVQTNIICKIVDWMFSFLIVLTILFVMIAAFKYLFSHGDKASDIHKWLIWAAVAIIVALLAKGFPFIVANFFEAGTFTGC